MRNQNTQMTRPSNSISDDVAIEIVHAIRDTLIELIHLLAQRNSKRGE